MFLKANVKPDAVGTEILIALMIAKDVWRDAGQELTVTAIRDGKHRVGSLHYVGRAVDVRTKDLPHDIKPLLIASLKNRVTLDYDIVFEDEGGSNEHLHIEYDPKP